MKKVKINLNEWHYQCADKCCDLYGTEIEVNGVKCENEYSGEDVKKALEFTLNQLGIEFEITETC